jgi:oligoribonuclease NrnB/cAMP/cGMP phosphodiesterase (DHH superfamily)
MYIDVFNGDADGICALIQLRLAQPITAQLVTGVKRDINLLERVIASEGDVVTVLDISLQKNRPSLMRILDEGAQVFYIDHHQAGVIPKHSSLTTLINTDANICTSLLVDNYLQKRFSAWAVTAAFGDNLKSSAIRCAHDLHLTNKQLQQLESLGICLNYNSYGRVVSDLHVAPDQLYKCLSPYRSPLDFIADNGDLFYKLQLSYQNDLRKVEQMKVYFVNNDVELYILPDTAWARRVSGVWANELANRNPKKAHAILSENGAGGYQVSVRAPLNNKIGADELCGLFLGGGGRKAAAGIDQLDKFQLEIFINAFIEKYRQHA